MANEVRGEVEIKLGGKRYSLRPTYEALAEIENLTDAGLIKLAGRFQEGDIRIKDVVAIIWAGMGDDAPAIDEVGRLVVAQGLADLTAVAGIFLAAALNPSVVKNPSTGKSGAMGKTQEKKA